MSRTPRRPFEKERLDAEIKIVGEYGETRTVIVVVSLLWRNLASR